MKDIYTLKEMNETRFERTYADNRLKRFKIKNVKDSLTKHIEIHEMLNITPEDSIDAIKKSNIINKNIQVDNEIRSKAAWNIAENSNANNEIFENDVTNNNLTNSKTQNIHAKVKSSTRRSNRLIEIENLLNSVERSTSIATFATIDEVSIKKE